MCIAGAKLTKGNIAGYAIPIGTTGGIGGAQAEGRAMAGINAEVEQPSAREKPRADEGNMGQGARARTNRAAACNAALSNDRKSRRNQMRAARWRIRYFLKQRRRLPFANVFIACRCILPAT